MREAEPKKIVYLFGAGATHAELHNLDPELIPEKTGLLIGNVSSRVIDLARRDEKYLKDAEMVSGTAGSLNIELLISLLENSKIRGWEDKTKLLKTLVQNDIENILSKAGAGRFYLHKALLELHKHPIVETKEQLFGLMSLNYDDVLDRAYTRCYGPPDYSFTLSDVLSPQPIPLLKLHGSFNWKGRMVRGRKRDFEIIPLGSTKNYLHAPYGFIWARALEILIKCDTLRVIGCSLSQNDFHLIDLLFKAHLERGKAFDIEIISPEDAGLEIRRNYGFFPQVQTLTNIEMTLVSEKSPPNPFKTWLKYKSLAMLGDEIERTQHLKRVVR